LVAWAIVTMTRAGSNVPTNLPTTTIVNTGPYRFNPIYLGMVLGLIGFAIVLNSLWLLLTLAPFPPVFRYGVVAPGETPLETPLRRRLSPLPRTCAALAVVLP